MWRWWWLVLFTTMPVHIVTIDDHRHHCVFIHGWGQRYPEDYWGSVTGWVDRDGLCSNTTLLRMDTVNHGWLDAELHDVVTHAVLRGEGGGGSTLIFTHSMGGLIFAEAIRRNRIPTKTRHSGSSNKNTVITWRVAAGTPWHGSPLAVTARRICESPNHNNRTTVTRAATFEDEPQRTMLQWAGQCDPCTGRVPRGLMQMADLGALERLRGWWLSTRQPMPQITICGTSPWGSGGWFGVEYTIVDEMLGLVDGTHDGVVPLQECRWGRSDKRHYKPFANHADLSCRTHNDEVCTIYGTTTA